MFKRVFVGVDHGMSFNQVRSYVNEFVGLQNIRELDTMEKCNVYQGVGHGFSHPVGSGAQ